MKCYPFCWSLFAGDEVGLGAREIGDGGAPWWAELRARGVVGIPYIFGWSHAPSFESTRSLIRS